MMGSNHEAFWSEEDRALCEALRSSPSGLTSAESSERLRQFGPNALDTRREATWWRAVWSQIRSPITLLLIFTAGLSFVLHEATEATMILVIIVVSTALGIWQERGASKTLEKLLAMVQSRSLVWRDGHAIEVPSAELVVGDVSELRLASGVNDDRSPRSAFDVSTAKQNIRPLSQRRFRRQDAGQLVDWKRLAGQRRLVDEQIARFQQPAIGRDRGSGREFQHVTNN